ncbi:MAG: OmpA family protein [Nonlabens sp.]|nr:OmpA family protein [Nonlabens sp.]
MFKFHVFNISFIIFLLACNITCAQNLFYFNSGSYELSEDAKKKLDLLITDLKSDADYRELKIVGHTDSDGDSDKNYKLSINRSKAVMNYLLEKNVANQFHLVGKGESDPFSSSLSYNQKAKNRRVEIIRVGERNTTIFEKENLQFFEINNSKDTVITGNQETKIWIRKNSFHNMSSDSPIIIELREFYDKSSFMKNNLTTLTTSNNILESAGMIHIKVVQNKKELQLKPECRIGVSFRNRSSNDNMELFNGLVRNGEVIWNDEENTSRVLAPEIDIRSFDVPVLRESNAIDTVASTSPRTQLTPESEESEFNSALTRNLILRSSKLGWINCDRFLQEKNFKEVIIEIDENIEPNISLVFTDINAVLPYSYRIENTYVFHRVPLNYKVHVLGISKKKGQQNLMFAKIFYNTATGKPPHLVFSEKTIKEVKKELEDL